VGLPGASTSTNTNPERVVAAEHIRVKRRTPRGRAAATPAYYKCPEHEDEIDALCLEQARQGVMLELWCSVQTFACHYFVATDVLEAFVADWFIFKRSGAPPIPADEFVKPYNEMIAERRL